MEPAFCPDLCSAQELCETLPVTVLWSRSQTIFLELEFEPLGSVLEFQLNFLVWSARLFKSGERHLLPDLPKPKYNQTILFQMLFFAISDILQ